MKTILTQYTHAIINQKTIKEQHFLWILLILFNHYIINISFILNSYNGIIYFNFLQLK